MSKTIKYSILILISICIFVLYIWSKNIFSADTKEVFKILYDGTFICGILYLCFAGLQFVSYEGVFDSLVYGIKNLFHIKKNNQGDEKQGNYGDYVIKNKERKVKAIPFNLWIGLTYVFFCIIFMIVYYNI